MRRKIVAGNWKMFTTRNQARDLAAAVVRGVTDDAVGVVLAPPFPWLLVVAEVCAGSRVHLAAQNCFYEKEGPFTGEVSPTMLVDAGCQHVLLGHSERRHKLGETDAVVNRKIHAALAAGLRVTLCVGETIEQRQANLTNQVLEAQLLGSLIGVSAEGFQSLSLAYEPVWAIGTGHNATPEQAQEAHVFLRQQIAERAGPEIAQNLNILYGGSVNPGNAADILAQPDVDGGLIGGASLKADSFLAIIAAARQCASKP